MSYTIGDGMVTFALAGSIVGYLYMKHQSRQKRIEIIHQERMAAMEKGIPLPEFPLEPARERRQPDPTVLPILGTVLLSLSVGAMIVLALNLPAISLADKLKASRRSRHVVGLIAYHYLLAKPGR